MGLVKILECDVFKTRRNIQAYALVLTRTFMGTDEEVWTYRFHLSKQAEERLTRFIKRGLTSPQAESGDDANTG